MKERGLTAMAVLALGLAGRMVGCGPEGDDRPVAIDDLPGLTLVEELRIGSVDDPDSGFSTLSSHMEVTEGDTLYVHDLGARQFRVHAPDGRLVRRIGREGEGPGELGSVTSWGMLPDTLWALDSFGGRLTLFGWDGRLLGTRRIQGRSFTYGPYFVQVRPEELLPGGVLLGALGSRSIARPGVPPVEARVPILRFDLDGNVLDTASYETWVFDWEVRWVEVRGVTMISGNLPNSLPLAYTLGPDSVFVERTRVTDAGQGSLDVFRTGAGGDTIWSRSFAFDPMPVTAAYRDSVLDEYSESYEGQFSSRAEARSAVGEAITFRPHHPAVTGLTVREDGTLWMRRNGSYTEGREPGMWEWIVLGGDGSVLGRATTPPDTRIAYVREGRVYTIERDDLGIPWVVRYRLREGGG